MNKATIIFALLMTVMLLFSGVAYAADEEETSEHIEYTDDEILIVSRVVFGEAQGESFLGKLAVANVVKNRYESGRFGRSIKAVAKAPKQFAYAGKTNEECYTAAEWVLRYGMQVLPSNTYYFRRSKSKRWRNFVYIGRIENHSFYTGGKPENDDNLYQALPSMLEEWNVTPEDLSMYSIVQGINGVLTTETTE